ncbi:hypothetical protein ACTTAM_07600 [Rhodobacter capsulatus]|uniref:hypothetical protein n=1 Tax=Rhodobacter capsulatus TaxID=1061 RepID=UPI004025E0F2
MMGLARLSLRLRIFLFFAALAMGNLAALVAGLVFGFHKLARPEALSGFVIGGTVAGLVILGLIGVVWALFDANLARPIERLAGSIRRAPRPRSTARWMKARGAIWAIWPRRRRRSRSI